MHCSNKVIIAQSNIFAYMKYIYDISLISKNAIHSNHAIDIILYNELDKI